MFTIWKADFENEAAYTRVAVLNAKALTGIKITEGKPLAGKLPVIDLEIVSDYSPSDYFNAGPLFVISERLRGLFENLNAAVEYHPVSLFNKAGELLDAKYFHVNFLEKVDCFDFEKSIYTMDGDFIDKIQRFEIDESKADNKPIFRLARSFDLITIVNRSLSDLILVNGITGIKFVNPSDWKW